MQQGYVYIQVPVKISKALNMLSWINDIFKSETLDARFKCQGFRIRGRRKFAGFKNRVLLLVDAYGPTSQINFIRPFQLQVSLQDEWTWWTLSEESVREQGVAVGPIKVIDHLGAIFEIFRPTIVVASRYGGPFARNIVDLTRSYKVPLVSHLDDNLLAVPLSNGDVSYLKHSSQERQHSLRTLLSEADLNYISTNILYEQLFSQGTLGKDVIVGGIAGAAAPIANAKKRDHSRQVFGYMGSQSHTSDLEMIAPAIAAVLQRFPKARFEIFGSVNFPTVLSNYDVAQYHPVKNYDDFLRHLSELSWSFGLAPLAVNDFTMAKTNIKWIEYTAAGIPVLASKHPIYAECCLNGAGILIDDDWQQQISHVLETPTYGDLILNEARHRLNQEYSPYRLHSQLMTVLRAASANAMK